MYVGEGHGGGAIPSLNGEGHGGEEIPSLNGEGQGGEGHRRRGSVLWELPPGEEGISGMSFAMCFWEN